MTPASSETQAYELPFRLFVVLAAANFLRIGAQLVVGAWAAVRVTGRADAAGTLLLISTIANLISSPILGAMVDSFPKKKNVLLLGHLGIIIAGAIPFLSQTLLTSGVTFGAIATTVVFAAVFSVLSGSSMDYYLKTHLRESGRTRRLAALSSTSQIALIIGTALGGLLVSKADASYAFLFTSLCGAFLAGLSWCILPPLNVVRDPSWSASKRGVFSAGPMLYLEHQHRGLFAIASCSALAFSIGQITNTLLPALIALYLHGTSVTYSMAEAAWSAGALLVGIWLASFSTPISNSIRPDLITIVCMAGVLVAVPYCSSFAALLFAHLLLGAGFAMVRIRNETRFLSRCPIDLLGRFRANGSLMTSTVGLVVFVTPTLFRAATLADLYAAMAGAVALSAAGLLFASRATCARGQHPPNAYSANKSGPNTP